MLGFLQIATDLNDVYAKFMEGQKEDGELNPAMLQERLRTLQQRMCELKPRIESLQAAREDLAEVLSSPKSLLNIAEKLPEAAEQLKSAERTLDTARMSAKTGGKQRPGKEFKRVTRLDHDTRMTFAMISSETAIEGRKNTIDTAMYEALPTKLRLSVKLSELQNATANLLRCGGRIPSNGISPDITAALEHLGIVRVVGDELLLSRKMGALLL